jgi:hypothetical protein
MDSPRDDRVDSEVRWARRPRAALKSSAEAGGADEERGR